MSEKLVLRILRQDSPAELETRRFEEFEVEGAAGDSIATALHTIAKHPVTREGKPVAPIAFESNCRADGCSACTMLVNGHVRPACRTPLHEARPKRGSIVLEPLSKFPVVRDLIVDKARLRTARLKLGAWLDAEAEGPLPVPRALAGFDRCTECGACVEACPETSNAAFVGAAALNEVSFLNRTGAGAARGAARLAAAMAAGGVASCGKARVCVEVCPERMPLFDSILDLEHNTTRLWLRTLLRR
ncbi:MAG: 4Fe-4S dicluster domain-containing protein [Myxococcales bacterium]|nr:4Fe-4S dicluster domain-containing protein [Myxococcales bacterium]